MIKRVAVFCGQEGDEDWPPSEATDFIKWFSDKVSQIPMEYKESAKIGLYGFEYSEIDIYYDRPETPEEESNRYAQQLMRQERIKAEELETLRRLKEKYGE